MVILLYLFPPHYFLTLRGLLLWLAICQTSCWSYASKLINSLQNRRVRGASTIHERARKTREQARSARREESACSHTIVYALPLLEITDMDLWRRFSHKTILASYWRERVSSYGGCREMNRGFVSQWVRREDFLLCRSELQRKCLIGEKSSGNPVGRCWSSYLGLKPTSISVFVVTQKQEFQSVKRCCQKCAREMFSSYNFLSHLKQTWTLVNQLRCTDWQKSSSRVSLIRATQHSRWISGVKVCHYIGTYTRAKELWADVAFCPNVPSGS